MILPPFMGRSPFPFSPYKFSPNHYEKSYSSNNIHTSDNSTNYLNHQKVYNGNNINNFSHGKNYDTNYNNTYNIEGNFKDDSRNDKQEAYFEIFGLKLFYDDILLISLIFFLYNEGVSDDGLFIALILLLLS